MTVDFSPPDPVKQKWIGPLPSQLRTLKNLTWNSRQDEYVAQVLQSARAVYADFFRCPLSETVQTALVPVEGERILAARWHANCGANISEVFLWDDPLVTTYFFKMPKQAMHERDLLASTVSDLFVWQGATPLKFNSVHFLIYRNTSTANSIGYGEAKISTPPLQFDSGTATGIWLQADSTAAWLSVTFGKHYVGHYPADMVWIQERFPPLRIRAREWSVELLTCELLRQGPFSMLSQERRNEVLLHELFTRKVDEDAFRSLMDMRGIDQGQILRIALEAGRGPQYRPVLVELVRSMASEPRRRWGYQYEAGIGTFLGYMKRAKDVDLTAEVMQEARAGHLDFPEIMYLTERIQSPSDAHEFFQLLAQNFNGDGYHDSVLKDARRQICARMALVDCGILPMPPAPH